MTTRHPSDRPDFWRSAVRDHRPAPIPDPEETTMTDQFTPDEAELIHGYSHGGEDSNNFADRRERREEAQRAIHKIKVDYLARLLATAETDTEWGVESIDTGGQRVHERARSEAEAKKRGSYYRIPVVSRRVLRTAWTTGEEGK